MNKPLLSSAMPALAEAGGSVREKRDSLLLRADLWPADEAAQARSVIVRNLSATGMMAECPRLLPEGRRVIVALRGTGDVAGTVVWTLDDRMGIAFDMRIDPLAARTAVGGAGTA